MNNETSILIDFIKELAKNKIDNDTKQGKDLMEKCLLHDMNKDCDNFHQNEVISFISRIDKEYNYFVKIFAKKNNMIVVEKKAPVDCKKIGFYVEMLNSIKNIKDAYEKGEKIEKILGDKDGQKF